jgi:hypothetical protein
MVAGEVEVLGSVGKTEVFPDTIREGVLHLVSLAQRGIVPELTGRVRVHRTGFMGVDGLAYLILYSAMGARAGGLRAVWGAAGSHSALVAAIIGRAALPSSSAMSRLLATITVEEVHAFSRWLLVHASGALDVMRSSTCSARNGQGRPFRLFAFDPVRLGVRWRGCPEGEDLPSVQRRSEGLAAPGHAGRKRGEAVVSIGVVQDLGSDVVLDVTVNRGNGDGRDMLGRAADAVVQTMRSLDQPVTDALLVADGEFGGVPCLTECGARNLPFLSRCARYELLDRPDVRARLENGAWRRVTDSGSGPTRYAVELGMIELEPGRQTIRDDGGRYEPVPVRLVASRYPGPGHGCGHLIGDNRFELFVVLGVPPSSLSASDIVTTFYARCGQENAFLQQKSLGAHRLASNSLGGQLFVAVAALLTWNLRLVAGVALSPPLPEASPPAPRKTATAKPPCLPSLSPPAGSAVVSLPIRPPDPTALADALDRVDWQRALRTRPGWTRHGATLIDPIGGELALVGVERQGDGRKLRFRGSPRAIQATISVPEDVGIAVATALRGEAPDDRSRRIDVPLVPPEDAPEPAFALCLPELCCANARNAFKTAALRTTVTVRLPDPEPAELPAHPFVEPNRHRRQHRRLTWAERTARYAAKGPAYVRVSTPHVQLKSWLRALRREV